MSERFVEAFVVAPKQLAALFGTPAVGFDAIKKVTARKPIWSDMAMTLGDGDEDDGLALVKTGLDELAAGEEPTIEYADRLTQLVLHATAERLKPPIMEANFLPADDSGLWNPAFAALGMRTIAKQWGEPNFAFPADGAPGDWPIITVVSPGSLVRWRAELATAWRKKLAKLPITALDPEATGDAGYFTRSELAHGIGTLEKWVTTACGRFSSKRPAVAVEKNSLVLVLDGDQ